MHAYIQLGQISNFIAINFFNVRILCKIQYISLSPGQSRVSQSCYNDLIIPFQALSLNIRQILVFSM